MNEKTNKIHELLELVNKLKENRKIEFMTQATMLNTVRQRKFIIGSISSEGLLSMSTVPFTHDTALEAQREAERLARLEPSKAYIVLQYVSGAVVGAITTF